MPDMATVLYFRSPTPNNASVDELVGARDIAAKVGWQIRDFNIGADDIAGLIDFWQPAGIIVESGEWTKDLDFGLFRNTPTVYLDHDPDKLPKNSFVVLHDSSETGLLAARELLSTDFPNFAFLPPVRDWWWAREREDGFARGLKLNGFGYSRFKSSRTAPDTPAYSRQLRNFLAKLPKPCAVFAANDRAAERVLTECRDLGLSCPGDIALLGTDNDVTICEHTKPSLSSIQPNFRRGGELAAIMLLAVLRDGRRFRGERIRRYGNVDIIRRTSTLSPSSTTDAETLAARELIRREACNGLRAETVLGTYHCSRPTAARRFQQAAGRTILEEIHAVQLARIKSLLVDDGLQLKSLADLCGFGNANSLRKFFLRETGMTMTAWRKRQA